MYNRLQPFALAVAPTLPLSVALAVASTLALALALAVALALALTLACPAKVTSQASSSEVDGLDHVAVCLAEGHIPT